MPSFECSWPILPLCPARGAQDARQALEVITPPPDPPAPVLDAPAPEQSACAHCGELFEFRWRGGKPRRFCSSRCRTLHHGRLARERKQQTNGGVSVMIAAPEEAPQGAPFSSVG